MTQEYTTEISEHDRIFILAKTYQVIAQYFAHWQDADIHPDELDTRFKLFLPRAIESAHRRDFALVMAEFISPLNNAHSRYFDRGLFNHTRDLGFRMRYLDKEWVVTESFVDTIAVGDVLLTIDGRAMEEWYEQTRRYTCVKGEASRRIQFPDCLEIVLDKPTMRVGRRNRESEYNEIEIARPPARGFTFDQMKTEGQWLEEGRVAYVKIPSFNKPEFEQAALDFIDRHLQARSMIVDVRGNTGGSTPGRLLRKLMNTQWRWSRYSSPMQVGVLRYWGEQGGDLVDFGDVQMLWRPREEPPAEDAYQGQVIILIDSEVCSAAEDFVIPFKDNGRAVLIGERTRGSTGQPYFYAFGQGISIFISTKRDYMPDGSQFEGVGIEPEIPVGKSRKDYYSGSDPALDMALKLVSE